MGLSLALRMDYRRSDILSASVNQPFFPSKPLLFTNNSPAKNLLYFFFLVAAGYNHLDVAEYLLENGADVNAQDKGGLIPMHNASSYGVSRKTEKESCCLCKRSCTTLEQLQICGDLREPGL